MSFFKKILAISLLSFLLATPTWAALSTEGNFGLEQTVDATKNAIPRSVAGANTLPALVGSIVSIALSFIGVIFFGLMLYAGFKWMLAMGNSEEVTKSKDTMTTAVIGLVIVLAAYAISKFVFSNLVK